ncbi:Multidrug resistance protein MdtA [wastewater metagenome]|uniref:Multidrug resistance protein MdtA n=2 Tax=unclassified sequences TaxID=12908 RepID=A0A5B8RDA0_9ZZZZ|nr:multidrug resistance protein MdtA [uncultured organism]
MSIIEVKALPFQLEARGRGVARPPEIWQATANVSGRVVGRHPRLESGNILSKGTQLLALDPTRYRLAIASAEAELAQLEAEKRQLNAEAANNRQLLELERDRLNLAERELDRFQRLAEENQISQSELDQQRRATLAQRLSVAKLENELTLIPHRRKQLQAKQEQARTRVDQAQEDLADTRFESPYDLRVSQVAVELHDQVSRGQKLFEAYSIEATEVEAHFPLPMLRRVVGAVARADAPPQALGPHDKLALSDIRAEVVLVGDDDVRWPARVARIASGLDPNTRTVRVVVSVDAPYEKAAPPQRPALQPGMYVRVRLTVSSPEPRMVIPVSAVHDNQVYLVTGENRLARQSVRVAFQQSDLAIIEEGLPPDARVIVDDPIPAIDGMPVTPRRDKGLERALRARARGEES